MAPHPPPALIHDVIIEILLRLPPDDIACLSRASLVCKAWRRIVSDRAFFRRYREIHGAPPVLGFLYNYNIDMGESGPLFITTTPTSPFSRRATTAAGSLGGCRTLDCRHGRVLLYTFPTSCLIILDPVTGLQRCIPAPVIPFAAALICASNGCDHLDCSNGPYLLVLLSEARNGAGVAQARAIRYSSETGKWGVSSASIIDLGSFPEDTPSSLLAGDTLFFAVGSGRVLKYNLSSVVLSAFCVPLNHNQNMVLFTADDGGLGVAAVEGCSHLRLLSGRTNTYGIIEWAQGRVIDLDSMIPTRSVGNYLAKFCVVGFAEGTGYIFVSANGSIFSVEVKSSSVEVKSSRICKIGTAKFSPIFPFMRFYIPVTRSC